MNCCLQQLTCLTPFDCLTNSIDQYKGSHLSHVIIQLWECIAIWCIMTYSSDSSARLCFGRMPTMEFEKFLLAPYTENAENIDQRRIEIPIHFGVPMLVLRQKHEMELSIGRSFIEAEPPQKALVDLLVDRLILNCTTTEDMIIMLSRVKPSLIFHAILEMLRRLPEPLFVMSPKGAQIASKISLMEPPHSYDFQIEEELYKEILRQNAEQGEENAPRFKRTKQRANDTIQPLIQKHYRCEERNRQKYVKMLNKFNKCVYHDIHMITDMNQRSLLRFIIRNVIFLARRYTISCFRRLREQRNERWPIARITTWPHIWAYANRRMAEFVGPVLIGQPAGMERHAGLEQCVMMNLLVCGTDHLWLPGKQPKDITVSLESSYCHSNCVCGMGLNVIVAQSSKSK
ncbi:unnamed protein product [Dicrocoelium dendriticum]|nr:unnamed protein product [Dicrocoelium dendriticum]